MFKNLLQIRKECPFKLCLWILEEHDYLFNIKAQACSKAAIYIEPVLANVNFYIVQNHSSMKILTKFVYRC